MIEHVVFFLIISAVTGVVSAAIRLESAEDIRREASHFFVMITAGVAVFCAVILALEWTFIRPPL